MMFTCFSDVGAVVAQDAHHSSRENAQAKFGIEFANSSAPVPFLNDSFMLTHGASALKFANSMPNFA